MPLITTLLLRLRADYPQYIFKPGDDFFWSSSDNTIIYNDNNSDDIQYLFHELSHAILGHTNYDTDIELLVMERQAWDSAKKLAKKYGLQVSDELIQSNLDSYRTWLHNRSSCPYCESNGLQINVKTYKCPECFKKWQVNDAKMSELRRYKLKNNKKRT